jgi:hypothetical protein
MKSQITLDYSQAQSFENEAITLAWETFYTLPNEKLEEFWTCIRHNFGSDWAKLAQEYSQEKWRFYYEDTPTDLKKHILACMPKFVSENTRFELLKLEMLAYITRLAGASHSATSYWDNPKKVHFSFQKIYVTCIKKINNFYPKWYINDAYNSIEIKNIKQIFYYLYQQLLINAYNGVIDDLTWFYPKIAELYKNVYYSLAFNSQEQNETSTKDWANYYINFGGLAIYKHFIINRYKYFKANYPPLKLDLLVQPPIDSTFSPSLIQFFSDELMALEEDKKIKKINYEAMQKDWEMFENQCKTLYKTPNEITISTNITTQSGKLVIKFKVPNKLTRQFDFLFTQGSIVIAAIIFIILVLQAFFK